MSHGLATVRPKTMKKKYVPKRGVGNTRLSISLPADLRDAIARAAAADKRTLSNYMVTRLQKILAEEAATK